MNVTEGSVANRNEGLTTSCYQGSIFTKFSTIRSRRIIFTPDVDLKDELANTAIQITCYDRNGDEVKRVTSSDDGIVKDDNDNVNVNPNDGPGGGDDNGGSNNDESDED